MTDEDDAQDGIFQGHKDNLFFCQPTDALYSNWLKFSIFFEQLICLSVRHYLHRYDSVGNSSESIT